MQSNFRSMIDRATILIQRGKLGQATAVIRQALWPGSPAAPGTVDAQPFPSPSSRVDRSASGPLPTAEPSPEASVEPDVVETPVQFKTGFRSQRPIAPSTPRHGQFVDGSLDGALRGRYKLFIPAQPGDRRPLIVLLHGCTQDPDDFAAGTGMNRRADEDGFYVLYPAQSAAANPSRCWNWFRPEDQQRGSGEPALIAAMTSAVIAEYPIDPDRVYIAGLSAGGAMAAIVAARYPEIFAAVGVHSGLPDGAARNLPDALSVMRTGNARSRTKAGHPASTAVPTIVFHGDQDRTVHPSNGVGIVEEALRDLGPVTERTISEPSSGRGKTFTRTEYLTASGRPAVESWIVHGGAHAWSGGHAEGRYTDPDGPSATDAMLRFFFDRRRSQVA
jgi:poly(hydroxyalkanoate) depolymerase family esterase